MDLIRFLMCAGVFGASGLLAAAEPPADAARIVSRWNQLRQAAPVVKYTVRWEAFPTDLKAGAPKPGEDGAYTGTGMILLDPVNGRLRADQDERVHFTNRRERLSRLRTTQRYDGREQSTAMTIDFDAATAPAEPTFRNVELGPWGSTMRWSDEFDPLLWGHGLVWTGGDLAARAFPLSWRAEPGRFLSAGREQIGDRVCIVLRNTVAQADSQETLWIDDERLVIVRWRRARPKYSVEIGVEYQQTPHGWLPQAWERSETHPAHPPTVRRRVTVTSVTFGPPVTADDFRIALRPEMTIRRDGELVRVRDDGSLEPEPAGPDPVDKHFSAAVRALGWPGLVGAAVAIGLVCVFVQLRRRRKSVGW